MSLKHCDLRICQSLRKESSVAAKQGNGGVGGDERSDFIRTQIAAFSDFDSIHEQRGVKALFFCIDDRKACSADESGDPLKEIQRGDADQRFIQSEGEPFIVARAILAGEGS